MIIQFNFLSTTNNIHVQMFLHNFKYMQEFMFTFWFDILVNKIFWEVCNFQVVTIVDIDKKKAL